VERDVWDAKLASCVALDELLWRAEVQAWPDPRKHGLQASKSRLNMGKSVPASIPVVAVKPKTFAMNARPAVQKRAGPSETSIRPTTRTAPELGFTASMGTGTIEFSAKGWSHAEWPADMTELATSKSDLDL
jgi:hypothetical protein